MTALQQLLVDMLIDGDGHTKDEHHGLPLIRRTAVVRVVVVDDGTPRLVWS